MASHNTAGLRVIQPGFLTLVQDRGRFGYQHLGLTTGGAADEHGFLWANRLLDNPANSAALEICIGGLVLEAQVATRIAITGADLQAKLNTAPIAPWQTYNLKPGDRLHFGYAQSGTRAYLAVQNGLQVNAHFGSVATVVREKLGGLRGDGSALRAGDWLQCVATGPGLLRRVPPLYIPDYHQPLTVRVIEERQRQPFSRRDLQRFYQSTYRISKQSNPMGMRLCGPLVYPQVDGILSEGVSFGTIQVPSDGQPIVLLKDRQTIGGYPKLGTAFTLDAFALCQRQPGAELRFAPIPLQRAQQLLREFYRFFGL